MNRPFASTSLYRAIGSGVCALTLTTMSSLGFAQITGGGGAGTLGAGTSGLGTDTGTGGLGAGTGNAQGMGPASGAGAGLTSPGASNGAQQGLNAAQPNSMQGNQQGSMGQQWDGQAETNPPGPKLGINVAPAAQGVRVVRIGQGALQRLRAYNRTTSFRALTAKT